MEYGIWNMEFGITKRFYTQTFVDLLIDNNCNISFGVFPFNPQCSKLMFGGPTSKHCPRVYFEQYPS